MNELNEDLEEYQEEHDRIKVFLKIKPSLASDKIFYNVSSDRKTILLLDNITLDDQKKTKKIGIDKIFTKKDENSYIYEEIMRNCVNNSLDGENFTFISYGDSNSEKHQLIIGSADCYENINNRGLLPRLLESYVNKIDSDEILSDTISLNLSYILINNNNLIDLSQLMGRENKELEKITRDELIQKYSKEIKIDEKSNINYIKSIKKAPIDKANDSLFFLLQILNMFYKLEATNNHFLTWSYFIIIIYVTDNNGKTVSTLSFIIMPGNEILLHRFAKGKSIIGSQRKDPISVTLKNNANECYYSVEDILEHLDVKYLNIEEQSNEKNNKKKEIKSKLFNIMGNIAFDINNKSVQNFRKYIIIGSIYGNSGLITNIKDTLSFLSQCQKYSLQKVKNNNKKESFFDNAFFKEKIKVKNDQIYDLESKVKTQEAKINELNLIMDSKEDNLKALQSIYKGQLELLKQELGFDGDIDNLLKGDKNSEEYEYSLKIRNTIESNRLKNFKIEELKNQINQIKISIEKLKNVLDMKENNFTMMEIVQTLKEAKIRKRKEIEKQNEAGRQIEHLKKQNKILEKKILGIKNEINLKKSLIKDLPDIFNNNMNINKYINKLNTKLNDVKSDYSLKVLGNSKEEIKRILNKENREKNIIIDKYENISDQNKNEIIKIGNKFNNINENHLIRKERYLDELVLLYKNIIHIIKLYQKSFIVNCSIFMKKEKFDKLLHKIEKQINPLYFPLLYDELGKSGLAQLELNSKNNKSRPKIIKSKYYKNIKEKEEDNETKLDENNKNDKDKPSYLEKNKRNERIKNIVDQIKNGDKQSTEQNFPLITELIEEKKKIFKDIVKKTHTQFITMSQDDLKLYANNFTGKIELIEIFINKYFENIDNIHKFDPVQEKIHEIKAKLKNINNKIQEITYKYKNNNIVFENGDKVIQRLKNENYLLRQKIYDYDKKSFYSALSIHNPNNSNKNKLGKRNFSNKDNMRLNINTFTNYNTILTTASTNNNMTGQFYSSNSSTGLLNQNLYPNVKDKMTIDANNTYQHKRELFLKRPFSTKKINPYFLVAENLKL